MVIVPREPLNTEIVWNARPNIGILLRGPYQEIVRRIAEELAVAGFDDIRPAHTAVFQHIKEDGSRLSELAQRAQLTKQSMGYLVDYLEERGYVERRPDAADRRASLIFLTERGWDEVRTRSGSSRALRRSGRARSARSAWSTCGSS
jgi:DNA-binding MarR family transcriptional regulator